MCNSSTFTQGSDHAQSGTCFKQLVSRSIGPRGLEMICFSNTFYIDCNRNDSCSILPIVSYPLLLSSMVCTWLPGMMAYVTHACLDKNKCLRAGHGIPYTNFRAWKLDFRLCTCWTVNESASDHVKYQSNDIALTLDDVTTRLVPMSGYFK